MDEHKKCSVTNCRYATLYFFPCFNEWSLRNYLNFFTECKKVHNNIGIILFKASINLSASSIVL